MKFAKGGKQNFSTEVFRIKKVIGSRPRPVYELQDLNKTPTEGQFYGEEQTPVRISKETIYKIDKILDKGIRRGIREYLVRWQCYTLGSRLYREGYLTYRHQIRIILRDHFQ